VISTRLTQAFGITHPIVGAPMALASGGALAAAVSRAGGLGLIGGGYGDATWLAEQFHAAAGERVGVGFITWSAQRSPDVVAQALEQRPAAFMLSFGDPMVFARQIHDAGVPLICQCQSLAHVRAAIDAGASVVVAQGAEAGGHGALRGTLSFVPEVADLLAARSPEALLLAAGGIADGRGLAAALTLGADGVLIGTRLWAATEALVHPEHHRALLATDGDGTIRTRLPDIARGLAWPAEFTARARRNAFTTLWEGREAELAASADDVAPAYREAWANGDADNAGVFFGEAAGLIHDVEPAAVIVERMINDAERALGSAAATAGG
jgi:nitronate monooxygenase